MRRQPWRAFWLLTALGALTGCGGGETGSPHSGAAGEAAAHGGAPAAAGTSSGGAATNQSGSTSQSGSASQSGGGSTGGNASMGGNVSLGGSTSLGGQGAGGASGSIDCRAKGDGKSTITLVNHCSSALSFRGSGIDGGDLAPGEHACRDVGDDQQGIPAIRFWGFLGEDPGPERYTLAELTLNTDFNDFDWYNISHVDAHNLPMQVQAVDMAKCRTLTCAKSLLDGCPTEGQLKDESGKIISCFNPHRDDKNSVVAQYFEAGCADAYSWSGDDQSSVVACAGEDYDVIFCP